MPLSEIDFVSPANVVGVTTSFFDGQIDLDPASSSEANTLINAYRYFTIKENGLAQTWKAKNVYLYPPRDFLTATEQPKETLLFTRRRRFQKSAQRVWLEECLRKYRRGEFEQAIIFLTSTEVALLVTQKLDIDLPICVLKNHPDLLIDSPGLPKLGGTRCLGFILYLPHYLNTEQHIAQFKTMYTSLGRVYC